jgi:hypothetical protein
MPTLLPRHEVSCGVVCARQRPADDSLFFPTYGMRMSDFLALEKQWAVYDTTAQHV